jgi:hypothetical protein
MACGRNRHDGAGTDTTVQVTLAEALFPGRCEVHRSSELGGLRVFSP